MKDTELIMEIIDSHDDQGNRVYRKVGPMSLTDSIYLRTTDNEVTPYLAASDLHGVTIKKYRVCVNSYLNDALVQELEDAGFERA